MAYFVFGTLLLLTSVFLVLLVLVQRGRGGGLTGALGGMGGQSAFGTKAGDMFTRITMGTAAFWILLCIASIKILAPLPETVDASSIAPGTAAPEDGLPVENESGESDEDVLGGAVPGSDPGVIGDDNSTIDIESVIETQPDADEDPSQSLTTPETTDDDPEAESDNPETTADDPENSTEQDDSSENP